MFKKQKAILAGIFALILILSSLSACAAKPEESDDNPSASNPSKEIETLALPTEFKAFECSADDYINYDCRINDSTFKFENNTLYLKKGGNEDIEIFRLEADLIAVAYVKNALFLSTYYEDIDIDYGAKLNEQRLYRIEIDEEGNYNSASFALITKSLAVPSYSLDNNELILNVALGQDSGYFSLNTENGELTEINKYDYNLNTIIENEDEIPSEVISLYDANQIALQELQNAKYYDDGKVPTFTGVDKLFYINPDISIKYSQFGSFNYERELRNLHKDWNYEKSSKYCWAIKADEDVYNKNAPRREAIVYIDAVTGKILFVRIIFDTNKVTFYNSYF